MMNYSYKNNNSTALIDTVNDFSKLKLTDKQIRYLIDEEFSDAHESDLFSPIYKKKLPTPIGRIPSEILSSIFRNLTDDRIEAPQDWKVVIRVCRRWREVAINDPILWADIIDFSDRIEVLSHLIRAKDVGLNITFIGMFYEDYSGGLDNLQLALRDMSRVRSLTIWGYNDEDIRWSFVQDQLSQPAAQLELLSIDSFLREQQAASYQTPSLAGITKAFRSLTITRYALPPPSNFATLQGLTTFSYKAFDGDPYRPNLKELINFLRATPQLRTLQLISCGLLNSRLPIESVTLMNLCRLEIWGMSADLCVRFLDLLVCPKSVEWSINVHSNRRRGNRFEELIFSRLNGMTECNRLSVTLLRCSMNIEAGARLVSGSEFRIANEHVNNCLGLDWEPPSHITNGESSTSTKFIILRNIIISNGSWSNITDIAFDMKYLDTYANELDWCVLLKRVRHLRSLKVKFATAWHTTTRPLACLAGVLAGFSTTSQMSYCPNLAELVLDSATFSVGSTCDQTVFNLVMKCCLARSAFGIPLHKVVIQNAYGTSEQDIMELKKCVGVVEWKPPTEIVVVDNRHNVDARFAAPDQSEHSIYSSESDMPVANNDVGECATVLQERLNYTSNISVMQTSGAVEQVFSVNYNLVDVADWDCDLHSIYSAFINHFQIFNIQWYNKIWGYYFTSFENFLTVHWLVAVVTDVKSKQAHIVTQLTSYYTFLNMIKDRYREDVPDIHQSILRITAFETGQIQLQRVNNMHSYKMLHATLPAAVLTATKERVRLGDPETIRKLWEGKDKTFLAIDFEWFERINSICLEWGYAALRCGALENKGTWPPVNLENYRFGHYIVSEYVDNFKNKFAKTYPWSYTFGKSQRISKTYLPQVIQAIISSLATPDSETIENTLVLIGHGISGDLARFREMNIRLPYNMFIIDTSVYERRLFNDGIRGPMPNLKTNQPRASGSTMSLANLALSLDIDIDCKYHNAGNDAFLCLLSLQKLLEPESVPKNLLATDAEYMPVENGTNQGTPSTFVVGPI